MGNSSQESRLLSGEGVRFHSGEVVAGKYRIDRLVAVGGMGVVWSATHVDLDRAVAIKVIRDEYARNEEAIARLMREARAAAQLRSRHVCQVLDVDRFDDGAPYIVMEFLDGRDLGSLLRDKGSLAPVLAVDWLLQACEGLAEAHESGIVHRDLKPENLFLARLKDGSTSLKVLDFGISKQVGTVAGGPSLTNPNTLLGSPRYMAPEQMVAGDVDHRADIWALGAILYELLCGCPAFPGDTIAEIAANVLGERLSPPLTALRPDLPDHLDQVIRRCLSTDRRRRFADVAALAAGLAPHGSGVAARSYHPLRTLLGSGEEQAGAATTIKAPTPHPGTSPTETPARSGLRSGAAWAPGSRDRTRRGLWLLTGLGALAVVAFAVRERPNRGERAPRILAAPSADAMVVARPAPAIVPTLPIRRASPPGRDDSPRTAPAIPATPSSAPVPARRTDRPGGHRRVSPTKRPGRLGSESVTDLAPPPHPVEPEAPPIARPRSFSPMDAWDPQKFGDRHVP